MDFAAAAAWAIRGKTLDRPMTGRRSAGAAKIDPKRRIAMSPKTMIAGLAVAALIAGTALVPTAAFAMGGGHGGSGNWPQPGTWNWPEYAGRTCEWVQEKYYVHNHVHLRSVQRCQ
jgi:hypothetical protein